MELETKPSALQRFYLTAAFALPVYLVLLLFMPGERWVFAAARTVLLALMTGIVATAIPVRRKWLFIVPSILAGVVLIYILASTHN